MNKGMNVILLAHPLIKRFDSPECAPYDRYQIKLHKTAAALVTEWADAVLFANYRVYTQETDAGFNKKINRGTGNGERIINTTERPAFHAKNRFDLPDVIPFNKDTAWNDFYTLVQQSRGITVPHATTKTDTQLP